MLFGVLDFQVFIFLHVTISRCNYISLLFSQADNQGILGRIQEFLKGGGGPFSSLPLLSSPFPSLPFPSALFPAVPSLPSLSSLPFPLEVGPL